MYTKEHSARRFNEQADPQSTVIGLNREIAGFLEKRPSKPTVSTVGQFCRDGFALYTSFLAYSMAKDHGFMTAFLFDKVLDAQWDEKTPVIQGNSPLPIYDPSSRMFLATGGGKGNWRVTQLMSAVINVRQHLAHPIVNVELDFVSHHERLPSHDKTYRPSKDQLSGLRFRGIAYAAKYLRLRQMGLVQSKPAIADYIAIKFAEQVAKDTAVDEILGMLHVLLRKSDIPGYTAPKNAMVAARETLQAKAYLDDLLTYAYTASSVANKLASDHGWNETQRRLIDDIAFLKRANLISGQFTRLLQPVVDAVIGDNWITAIERRDFLLKRVGQMFPRWRQDKQALAADQITSIDDLVNELLQLGSGQSAQIPTGYKEEVETRAVKKREEEREEKIKRDVKLFGADIIETALISIGRQLDPSFNSSKEISKRNPMHLPVAMWRDGYDTQGLFITGLRRNEDRKHELKIRYKQRGASGEWLEHYTIKLALLLAKLRQAQCLPAEVFRDVRDGLKAHKSYEKEAKATPLRKLVEQHVSSYINSLREHQVNTIKEFLTELDEIDRAEE